MNAQKSGKEVEIVTKLARPKIAEQRLSLQGIGEVGRVESRLTRASFRDF
jgi:hypothetical protein